MVDEFTNTDDTREYKLVMVGRKINEQEGDLRDLVDEGQQHVVSQDVFHESGEKFA